MNRSEFSTQQVDHLGIVAGICEQIDLIGQIDRNVGFMSSQHRFGEVARKGGGMAEEAFIVSLSEDGITCRRPTGVVESVTWDDLRTVILETNDLGPFASDMFWLLIGDRGDCLIPSGAPGEKELLERFQKLEGFDNEAFIKAMTSTSKQRFLCWQRT